MIEKFVENIIRENNENLILRKIEKQTVPKSFKKRLEEIAIKYVETNGDKIPSKDDYSKDGILGMAKGVIIEGILNIFKNLGVELDGIGKTAFKVGGSYLLFKLVERINALFLINMDIDHGIFATIIAPINEEISKYLAHEMGFGTTYVTTFNFFEFNGYMIRALEGMRFNNAFTPYKINIKYAMMRMVLIRGLTILMHYSTNGLHIYFRKKYPGIEGKIKGLIAAIILHSSWNIFGVIMDSYFQKFVVGAVTHEP